jgi:hypothetical protein
MLACMSSIVPSKEQMMASLKFMLTSVHGVQQEYLPCHLLP